MWRYSVRNVLGHKRRLFTTGFAVMIGIAFLSGTLVLRDTMKQTFDDLFERVYANIDAVVRSSEEFEDPSGFGVQRGRIPEALLADVLAVDGVDEAQVDIFGYAQVVGRSGDPVGNPQSGAPTVGGNWPRVAELNPWRLIDGRAPRADDEVVLDRATAETAGYGVGDTVSVIVLGPPRQVKISGIVKFGESGSTGGAGFVLFTTDAAQRLVGEVGMVDTISVTADEGVSQAEVTRRLDAALPGEVQTVTGSVMRDENQQMIEDGMSVFNTFMLIFALIALFVGVYIVFNTFFITVAQRGRENALLRAIGASRPQVLLSVLIEAAAVGLVASVFGVFGGLGVAAGLKALLVAMGVDLPLTGVVFTPTTAVTGFVTGMVVTVGAAIVPARRAGRVPPVAAIRAMGAREGGYGSRQRVVVGLGILVTGGVAVTFGLSAGGDQALPIVGVAVMAVFIGVTVLGRTISLPISRFVGWPIAKFRGIAGELARENAMRNPRRTVATASALMIGVGLVSFISIFAASTKASINETIDQSFLGDFAITSSAMAGNGGLAPELGRELNALPEVDVAGGVRVKAVEVDGTPVQLLAADLEAFEIFDVGPLAGAPQDLDEGSIGVHEETARKRDLQVGDTVQVRFVQTGVQELRVAMIYEERQPAGDWLLGIPAYEKNVAEQYDFQVFVRKTPAVTSAAALAAIERVVERYPGADLLDHTEYKEEQTAAVDQMLGLIYALLALAIVIALLGIGNTLALSILERIHELGVLRAVGMTRSQLRSAVRWESVIIAAQGSVLGLIVGVFLGWAMVNALSKEGITTLALPATTLAMILFIGAVAGVVAAVLPARRAARIDILRAVSAV